MEKLLQGKGEFFFGGQVGEDLATIVYTFGAEPLDELYQKLTQTGVNVRKLTDVSGGPIQLSVESREENPNTLRFTLPLKQGPGKASLTFEGKRKIDGPPHFIWEKWFLREV